MFCHRQSLMRNWWHLYPVNNTYNKNGFFKVAESKLLTDLNDNTQNNTIFWLDRQVFFSSWKYLKASIIFFKFGWKLCFYIFGSLAMETIAIFPIVSRLERGILISPRNFFFERAYDPNPNRHFIFRLKIIYCITAYH